MPFPNYFYNTPNLNYGQQSQGQNMQQIQPQIQNGGFVIVRNEMEARNYPVGFGTSVMFKDETSPYIYSKTMGFSQLDRPIFEKYKLVKEEPNYEEVETNSMDSIRNEMNKLWEEVNLLKEERNEQSVKRNAVAKTAKSKSDEDIIDAV